MSEYLENGGQRESNIVLLNPAVSKVIYAKTLHDKRDIIYSFYAVLQNQVGLLSKVVEPKPSISDILPEGTPYRWPLPYRRRPVEFGLRRSADDQQPSGRRERRRSKERLRHGRPTPDPEQSTLIIMETLDREDENRAATFHLAAKLERYATARSGGVADLCVASIRAGILEEFSVTRALTRELPPLELMFSDGEGRDELLNSLRNFRTIGRRFIFINVIEKGEKVRHLAVPVELVIEIIDYIWTFRHQQVVASALKGLKPSDHVFLSYRTSKGFEPDSIGKELRAIFRKLRIPGSPHRLRAAGAEDIVRELYLKQKAQNPGAIDFRSILEIASEMLGHKNIKTIRKYINKIHREEQLLSGYSIVLNLARDADVVRSIAAILNEPKHPLGVVIRSELDRILVQYGIPVLEMIPTSPLTSWNRQT